MFENIAFWDRKNKQVFAERFQKRPFLTVNTRWRGSLMTSQNASFGQDKKTMQKTGFQYRMCKNPFCQKM